MFELGGFQTHILRPFYLLSHHFNQDAISLQPAVENALTPPECFMTYFCQILPGKVTARVQQHVLLITTCDMPLSHWVNSGLTVLTNDAQMSVVRQGHLMEHWNTGRSSASVLCTRNQPGTQIVHAWDNTEMAPKFHVTSCCFLPLLLLF